MLLFINPLRPEQDDWQLADNIFKLILSEKVFKCHWSLFLVVQLLTWISIYSCYGLVPNGHQAIARINDDQVKEAHIQGWFYERRCYTVMSSLIGWAHTQNDPWGNVKADIIR